MQRVAAFFVVVLGNIFLAESAHEPALCRCEASFERLYDRRHRLLEGFERGLKLSALGKFPYDYDTAYTNDEGYFVIDGVIVLPDDNELCQAYNHDNRVKAWMTSFGDRRNLAERNLTENSNKQRQSRALRGNARHGPQGKGRGKNGMSSGAVRNDPSDFSQRYYFYGGGKANGKGVERGKGNGKGKSHAKSSKQSKRNKSAKQSKGKNQRPCSMPNDYSPECLPEIFPCEDGTAFPSSSPIGNMDAPTSTPTDTPSTFPTSSPSGSAVAPAASGVPSSSAVPFSSGAPTSLPTASPLGIPIVNTCPDGSVGPQDPKNCATKCDDDDADIFERGCLGLCSSVISLRTFLYGCICTGNSTDPTTCKEACCPPLSSSPSTSPSREPSIVPSLPPTLLPTTAPFANILPACNITDDCPASLNQCERYFCNASSTCQLGPGLDCNDNNQCTIDSCSSANGCEHVPVSCSQNESCDPFDGQCKPNESLRPCIAVIDESNMSNATVNSKWATFRAGYPDRPFCLLRPLKSGNLILPTAPDFLSDPRTTFANVSRDEGDPSLASDWFTNCGISLLNSTGVDFVGLFIDTSGSMTLNTVRASYEKFLGDLNATNLSYCTVTNRNEDWITPFNTTLGEIGGGGECVVNRL